MSRADTLWTNWSGDQSCTPVRVSTPATVADLADVITRAAREGLQVKPIGSGHSFTAVGCTDGVQIRMDRLTGLVAADAATGLVTLGGGTHLYRIPGLLAPYGLAMTNLGDIDRQTLTGAISTGTHGTGERFGGISTQVRALELVLADGSVVTCSAAKRPELFAAARIGLGALGVITAVTLQCEPAYALVADERRMPLDAVLASFDRMAADNDHAEFFWFPHTGQALVKRNNRCPLDRLDPLPAWREAADRFTSTAVFEATCRLGARAPRLIPAINAVAARALGASHYTDVSHRVFASPRTVRFRETEYAIPRAHLADAVREIRSAIDGKGWRISFPVEVRTAAADDIWLSTAHARDTAYIAVHLYHRSPAGLDAYFRAVEDIAGAVGGRPHWGKMHTLGAAELAGRYPRFADFTRLRAELDPQGVFANDYLDRVLTGASSGRVTRSHRQA